MFPPADRLRHGHKRNKLRLDRRPTPAGQRSGAFKTAFSVETAGSFDRDTELELWFSGLGKVRLEFKANADIRQLGQMIAGYVL